MYAFVKLKSGIAWSGPKQLSTICANKVYKTGDQDLWNNCEKTCWKVAFVFWLQPSTQPQAFLKGLGVAQVCKVGDDTWQKQVFHHLFFQHFGTFRLATFVIWVCFLFPWHLLRLSGSGGARLCRYVVCTRVVWSRRAGFRRVLIDTSWRSW